MIRMLWPWPWKAKIIPPLDSTYLTSYKYLVRLSRYLNWLLRYDILGLYHIHKVHSPKFDIPLLSYHFDTSNLIFQETQDVGFPKMYGRNVKFPPRMVPATKFSGSGPWTNSPSPARPRWVSWPALPSLATWLRCCRRSVHKSQTLGKKKYKCNKYCRLTLKGVFKGAGVNAPNGHTVVAGNNGCVTLVIYNCSLWIGLVTTKFTHLRR